jgi:NADH dehydrogenase
MVLVTGGSGVVGRKLIQRLHENGCSIRLFCLPGDPNIEKVKPFTDDIRLGNIAHEQDIIGLCEGVETVYHLASIILADTKALYAQINVKGTHFLLDDALLQGVKHFVYVSSASVIYLRQTPYSLSKKQAEELVVRSGVPYTIVRPTLVYDEKTGGQEFDLFLDYLKRFPVVPFIGKGKALKRPVFVDDVIQGLLLLFEREYTYGKIYNLSGGEVLSMIEFTRLCMKLLGMEKKRIVHLPVWLCMLIAHGTKLLCRKPPLTWQTIAGIIQDANLDPKDSIRDLAYQPQKVSVRLARCFPRGNLM